MIHAAGMGTFGLDLEDLNREEYTRDRRCPICGKRIQNDSHICTACFNRLMHHSALGLRFAQAIVAGNLDTVIWP